MSLIKWTPMLDPFEEMDNMLSTLRPMRGQNQLLPAVDIYEEDGNVIAETPLPGINIDDVIVCVENDVLTIEGKAEKKTEVEEKNYYRKEIRSGSFHRVIQLPVSVDGDQAAADYVDGVLKISIPKRASAQAKNVKINKK